MLSGARPTVVIIIKQKDKCFCFLFRGGLSSCEAEIDGALRSSQRGRAPSRGLLSELGDDAIAPTSLATDNTAARGIAYNPEHHKRVKHIERRHFYVRECVENMQLVVPYVNTLDNMADFFTKPLDSKAFHAMRNVIMNVPVPIVAVPERSSAMGGRQNPGLT